METDEKEGLFKRIGDFLKEHPIQSIWNLMGLVGLIVATANPATIWELLKFLLAVLVLGADWLKAKVPPAFHGLVEKGRAGVNRARRTLRNLLIVLVLVPMTVYLITAFASWGPYTETLNLVFLLWFGLGTLFLAVVISAAVVVLEKGLGALPIIGKSFQYQPGAKKLSSMIVEAGIFSLTFALLFGIFHVQMQVWGWSAKIIAFLSFLLLVCTMPRKTVRRIGVAFAYCLFLLTVLVYSGRGLASVAPQPVKDRLMSGINESLEHGRIFGDFLGKQGVDISDAIFLAGAARNIQVVDGRTVCPDLPGDPDVSGDMNGDGKFTEADARYLRAYVDRRGPAPVKRQHIVSATAAVPVANPKPLTVGVTVTVPPAPAGQPDTSAKVISVPSDDADGVPVDLTVRAGQLVTFNVTGTVDIGRGEVGPAGETDGYFDRSVDSPFFQNVGGLEGWVGEKEHRFFVGNGGTVRMPGDGEITLRVIESSHGYTDGNRGAFFVRTKIVS